MRQLFFLILAGLASPLCLCSQPYIFEHLTMNEGLSSDKVLAVLQDRQGYYWVATANGLNRFDGSAFKVYMHEENNPGSLADNHCSKLLEDKEGNIWIATYKGISVFDKKENHFRNLKLSYPEINADILNRITGMVQDAEGNIWISTIGLWKYDYSTKKLTSFLLNKNDPASLTDKGKLSEIQYDQVNHGIWFARNNGIVFYSITDNRFYNRGDNPKGWKIFSYDYYTLFTIGSDNRFWFYKFDSSGIQTLCLFDIARNEIIETPLKKLRATQAMMLDDKNRIWIGFYYGSAWIYDPTTKMIDSSLLNKNHSQAALQETFNYLYIDRQNNYWICSAHGISILNPSRQFYNLYEMDVAERTDFNQTPFIITSIAATNNQSLWVGSVHGLYYYNLVNRQYRKVRHPLLNKHIETLLLENDSILWVGGKFEVYKFDCYRNKIITSIPVPNWVQVIAKAADNNLWLGTWSDGLYKISPQGKPLEHFKSESGLLPSNKFLSLHPDGDDLWMGFNGGEGFANYNFKEKKFNRFSPRIDEPGGMESGTVNVLSVFDNDHLWLGTYGDGIYVWNQAKNQFKHYSQSDGLSGSFINSIRKDKMGNAWISTSNGIDFFNSRDGRFINIKPDFIFTTNDYVQNSCYGEDGHLFFFCMNRIIEIDPTKYQVSQPSYPIVITDFRVFDKEVALSTRERKIHLTHHQNFFSFEFSTLKTNVTEPIQYAYKLEGFDKDWQYVGKRRFASYTNVPGGKYEFKLKAANQKGEWSEQSSSLAIVITPPFWKTWWFLFNVSMLISFGMFIFYRYRITQIKKLYSLRSTISQDLHDEVASTLSGIKLYSELAKQHLQKKDVSKVQQSLEVISVNASEIREDMSDIIWAINPRNDSLGKLLQKLKLYANELTKAATMKFSMSVDENLPEEKLNMEQRRNIYLICKEAVHNAVKYSRGKEVEMNVFREDHSMQILIKDNGSGFDTEHFFAGNGLLNMRTRAKEIGAYLAIRSNKEKGTTIELKMKL